MTDKLQQVLDTPGCERLKDFAAVGPAQRAALELFVERLRAAEGERVTFEMVNEAQRAVQEAVAAERKACAKLYAALTYSGAAHDCAVAIRARGEK